MICTNAATTRYPTTKPTWKMNREELAKVYALHHGWHTHRNGGGWVYDAADTPLVQGWTDLARRLEAAGRIVVGKGISWSL